MLVLLFPGAIGFAQDQVQTKDSSDTSQEMSTPVVIDSKADDILKQMSEYMKCIKQFTFHADVTFEKVLESGQKLQFGRKIKLCLQRPNKYRVEITEQKKQRLVLYNGNTLTLLHLDKNVYSTIKVPETIDKALDFMMNEYGVDIPLADLYFSDPYDSLVKQPEGMELGTYLGEDKVGDLTCHHLAFCMKNIDWQIWIEEGEELLPRKFLITYKTMPGMPQFCAIFTEWNTAPRFHENLFKFTAPEEAQEIEFLTLRKTGKSNK